MKVRCSNFAACDIINCYHYSKHEPYSKAVERPHHVWVQSTDFNLRICTLWSKCSYTSEDYVKGQGSKITTPVYHGTNEDFIDYELGKRSGSTATILRAHFFTDTPESAKMFGEKVKTAHLVAKKPVIINYQESGLSYQEIQLELDTISKGLAPSEDLLGAVKRGNLNNWDVAVIQNVDYEGNKPFTEYIVKDSKSIVTTGQAIKKRRINMTKLEHAKKLFYATATENNGEQEYSHDLLVYAQSSEEAEEAIIKHLKEWYADEKVEPIMDETTNMIMGWEFFGGSIMIHLDSIKEVTRREYKQRAFESALI